MDELTILIEINNHLMDLNSQITIMSDELSILYMINQTLLVLVFLLGADFVRVRWQKWKS